MKSNQDSVKIKVLETDYKKVVSENHDLRQMIDEYGEKSLQENRKIKMLEEEAKSTKEKLELQLLDQNINIKLIGTELENAKVIIQEKDKELAKWRNSNQHNYANDSIKKKLNDYIVLLDVHQKCTEKIRGKGKFK